MATLKDVAKKSGVSVGTASAVFNNKNWVKEEVRKRVLQAAEALNYQPNILARNLKTRKSNTIGVVVSDITNPFFSEVFSALEKQARKQGFSLLLGNADENPSEGLKVFNSLVSHQVEGAIIIGRVIPEPDILTAIAGRRIPVIAVEGKYEYEEISTINVDSIAGGFTATKHLLQKNYWPVVYIGGPESETSGSGTGRFQGFLKALESDGKKLDNSFICKGNFRFDGGYKALKDLLSQGITPRAVFAANDLMAIGAMEAAKEAGLSIPEDIAFVGYDNIPSAAYCSPALSTIPLPMRELGEMAFKLFLDKRNKPDNPRQNILISPAELVVRKSCS